MTKKIGIIGMIFIICIAITFVVINYIDNNFIGVQVAVEDVNDDNYEQNNSFSDGIIDIDEGDILQSDETKYEDENIQIQNDETQSGKKENIEEQKQNLLGIEEKDKEAHTESNREGNSNNHKEFRAAWVSTVYNLDWPSRKGLSQSQQKQEFVSLLDQLKKAGLNSVIVQIKPSADSFYPSKYAPWSEYLTGVQGKNPGYNPLTFMIEEAHKRGMEFHAWFNPYRVSVKDNLEELTKDHPAIKNPDWLVNYGGKLYYNPGIPEVRQFVIDSILEVVKDYNIDGVHLDDYFYPYPEKGIDFPDDGLYIANKRSDKETKLQWRRNNINDFIENLYKSIKKEKPNVKFGVSPFGIWRNKEDDSKGSNTKGGVTSYDSLHADTKYWVEKGWLDYIAPQLYWYFGYDRADYGKLVDWWVNVTKGTKVDLYVGHAAYKVEEGNTPWGNPLEIIDQIKYNRSTSEVKGSIFFRARSIVDNPLGLTDKLKDLFTD